MNIKKSINESLCKKICETFSIRKFIFQKSNTQKSNTQKRSEKSIVLIALMFFGLMSPKAWGYAQKELPPSFSSGETFSSDETFSFSRAILADENGVAICQVNLVENPEFLPQFAEPGSSDLPALDLPECEEQSLDIVAQYAEEAWVKRDVAIAPAALMATGGIALVGGCALGLSWLQSQESILLPLAIGTIGLGPLYTTIKGSGWNFATRVIVKGTGVAAVGGLFCYSLGYQILYLRSFSQENEWPEPDMP